MLRGAAEREQEEGQARKLRAELVIELREARHHKGDQKDKQRKDHDQQKDRVDQRGSDLFAKGQRDPLKSKIARQHLFQVAGALAGEQGRRINGGDITLCLEGLGEGLPGADAGSHVLQLCAKAEVLLSLGQQIE